MSVVPSCGSMIEEHTPPLPRASGSSFEDRALDPLSQVGQSPGDFDTASPWGTWVATGATAFRLGLIGLLPRGGIGKRLAFALRKPVKNGAQAIYDRQIWGLRLRLAARGNLTEQRWLTMPEFHDFQERQYLARHLSPGAVFLDIGANAGFYTFWALSLGRPGLRVIAAEPNETMLARVRHNLAENQLAGSVTLFPCAVTPEPCEVVILENPVNHGQTAISTAGAGRSVPGRPLLDLLEEAAVHRVDAMKIDIEGFEVPVLAAFFESAPLTLWPERIVAEIFGPGGQPLLELLGAHGYRLEGRTKMNGMLALSRPVAEGGK